MALDLTIPGYAKPDTSLTTHLNVDSFSATFVFQYQVIGTGIIFVCFFDDQFSDFIIGGDHGSV